MSCYLPTRETTIAKSAKEYAFELREMKSRADRLS
jgi:hypothetical protein